MSQKAIYNTDKTARIVNRGRDWYFQRMGSGKGTNTFDPWSDESKSMELAQAKVRLASTETKKKEAA